MAKIPFDIRYRQQIESGEYKVETTKGQPVRIICWDRSTTYWKIIGLVLAPDGRTENPFTYDVNGKESDGCLHNHDLDLFIVTPEKELTEFEKVLGDIVKEAVEKEVGDNAAIWAIGRGHAEKLLALAEKEIAKGREHDVYIPEDTYYEQLKKQWEGGYDKGKAEALRTYTTELTENLVKSGMDKDSIPYHLIEFMCNLYDCQNWKEIEETAEAYVTRIKAAALKDLPRWKKCQDNDPSACVHNCVKRENSLLYYNGHTIRLIDLEKLPGFKED